MVEDELKENIPSPHVSGQWCVNFQGKRSWPDSLKTGLDSNSGEGRMLVLRGEAIFQLHGTMRRELLVQIQGFRWNVFSRFGGPGVRASAPLDSPHWPNMSQFQTALEKQSIFPPSDPVRGNSFGRSSENSIEKLLSPESTYIALRALKNTPVDYQCSKNPCQGCAYQLAMGKGKLLFSYVHYRL